MGLVLFGCDQVFLGLPWWLSDKESICQCRRRGFDPEERNGNPLQYSCLGNPTDRGAWQAIVHGVCKGVRHDFMAEHTRSLLSLSHVR